MVRMLFDLFFMTGGCVIIAYSAHNWLLGVGVWWICFGLSRWGIEYRAISRLAREV
jgi:hypothetical protein